MQVDPQDKKKYDQLLTKVLKWTERSIVSLRKEEWEDYILHTEILAEAMMDLLSETDQEILPIESLVSETDWSKASQQTVPCSFAPKAISNAPK